MMARGIEYLQQAMQRPNAPEGTALLIASLLRYREDKSAMLEYLEQAYLSESDPKVRRNIELRLRAHAGGDRRQAFERMRRQRAHWKRVNYDYVSEGLAFQLGPRRSFIPATVRSASE
jgi:hypothetical protein